MEPNLFNLFLLPAGLGLLGFVEPCTIGGHLLFLNSQRQRSFKQKTQAVTVFVMARALVAGLVGIAVVILAGRLIQMQTQMWLVFGVIYLILGLLFLSGRTGMVKQRISLAPENWKKASSPLILGLAFGLNIPACAAPVMFGLLGLAATGSTYVAGFWMMFIFGFFLSIPLALFTISPKLAGGMDVLAKRLSGIGWLTGLIFIGLGIWSIWFGLNVNPADWSGK